VAGNYLVSTDAVQTTIADESIGFDADDNDSREAGGHQNSTTLYTQEIQGLLTTDGAAAVAKGTIIRADLVTFEEAMTGTSGNITVPCTCASGKSTVAIDNPRRSGWCPEGRHGRRREEPEDLRARHGQLQLHRRFHW
jgi:hypothetical protein